MWPLSTDVALVFLVIAAPAVGSFLAMLVDRLPRGGPIVLGRSHCGCCGRVLGLAELVPIIGPVLSRGACRGCGAPVGPVRPLMEVGAFVVALWALAVLPVHLVWPGAALGWTLLALAEIDRRHLLLPDALTIPLLAGGLALAATGVTVPLPDALSGALGGGALLAGIAVAFQRWTGREGLGLGDAKIFAAAGAWIGWQGLPGTLLIAAGSGLAVAIAGGRLAEKRGEAIPFGPFLAAGIWLSFLHGPIWL